MILNGFHRQIQAKRCLTKCWLLSSSCLLSIVFFLNLKTIIMTIHARLALMSQIGRSGKIPIVSILIPIVSRGSRSTTG